MPIDRRDLIKHGSAFAVATMVSGTPRVGLTQNASDFGREFDAKMDLVRRSLVERGFAEVAPMPIVTGIHHYNGGLQHDADVSILTPASFVIQPSARVDDAVERGRTDLLPIFHVLASQAPEGQDHGAQARFMVGLLIDTFGLAPSRIAFATVPEAVVMQPAIGQAGFDFSEKVLIRDEEEALARRDTSGYFFPDPTDPNFLIVSVGVYYRLTEEGDAGFKVYPPPPEWTEVAEFSVSGIEPPAFAIGIERLALAASGFYPTWEERLPLLFEKVEQQVGDRGLPPGLEHFRQQ
jgi:hypothetical protein